MAQNVYKNVDTLFNVPFVPPQDELNLNTLPSQAAQAHII